MRIALIRHPAPLIDPGVCYGRLDVGVTAAAADQIAGLAGHPGLQGAQRVWTSPAVRCRCVADAIAERLAITVRADPRLWELDFGDWEGRSWDAIERADLDRWAASPVTFAPPGGESGAALIARLDAFQRGLRRAGQDCVVVSHGGPLKLLEAMLRERPVDLLAAAPAIGSLRFVECQAGSVI